MQLEVSTVSRHSEEWWSAPGAIDIVTSEDIRRSGVSSLPDALRLVTGVHVSRPVARNWGVGIRGFTVVGGSKVNVQLDGRTLFTPFFSGVFWDAQDTMLQDIDRIEVVRGPVGAVWGAHAVNGFIQILTKPAWETQGVLASAAIGTDSSFFANVRFGGHTSRDTFYRVYAQYRTLDPVYLRGERADAASDFLQSGFRVDTRIDQDTTLIWQGDLYSNKDLIRDGKRDEIAGANLNARWRRLLSLDSELEFSTYYDFTDRRFASGLRELRSTVQLNGRLRLLHGRHQFQIGTDNTFSWDTITNLPGLQFDPTERGVHTVSLFASDTFTIVPDHWSVTVGAKLEHNSFSGVEVQPTVRLAWTSSRHTTLWSAISRAVRTPVRFDHDVVFPGVFMANDDFGSETVIAYELGFRHKPYESLAIDVALFENRYDDLRAYQPIGAPLIPLTFQNMLNAESRGAEITLLYEPFSRLFLKGSYRYFELDFTADPGSRNPFGTRFEANDPKHLATLTARLSLPRSVEFDTTVRYVSSLPWRRTKGYLTADVRVGWSPRPGWELALIGRDLLDPYHVESIIPQQAAGPGREVKRSVMVRATWEF